MKLQKLTWPAEKIVEIGQIGAMLTLSTSDHVPIWNFGAMHSHSDKVNVSFIDYCGFTRDLLGRMKRIRGT